MRKNIILGIIIILFLIIGFTKCCDDNKATPDSKPDNIDRIGNLRLIQNAKYIEEIANIDTIKLKIPIVNSLGIIKNIHISQNRKIYLTGMFSPYLLIFDEKGNFIRKLGEKGQGPGEFSLPHFFTTNNSGELIVGDCGQFRISLFDENDNFKSSFNFHHGIDNLALFNNNIIVHTYLDAMRFNRQSIHIYNTNGVIINKFGKASKSSQELKNLPFRAPGPYIAIYDDNIYEAEYSNYHIRKYDKKGKLIIEFGIKPKNWNSVLETDYKKLPKPQMVTPSVKKELKQYFDEFAKHSIVFWIASFDSRIIAIMTRKLSNDYRDGSYLTLYDLEGNVINNGLTFDWNHYSSNRVEILPLKRGICLIQYLDSFPEQQPNLQMDYETINLLIYNF